MFFIVLGFFVLIRRNYEWMDAALIAYILCVVILCVVTYIAQYILRKL